MDKDGKFRVDLDLEEKIWSIKIFQEVDIYKGISVGKSINEINENPDLLHRMDVYFDEMDGSDPFGRGFYDYNGIFIGISLTLNDDLVCTEIDMAEAEDARNAPNIELWLL